MTRPELVFGYGSLLAPGSDPLTGETEPPGYANPAKGGETTPPGYPAELTGFSRGWGVAMDNSVDLPGYKFYVEPNGRRPGVFVAFLDLVADPAPDAGVIGICRPFAHEQLAELDRRERNYVRVDVSDRFDHTGRVWTYVGSRDGRARLREGRRRGAAVIHAGYLQSVRDGARAARIGPAAYEAFEASLDPAGLPVVELERCELALPQ